MHAITGVAGDEVARLNDPVDRAVAGVCAPDGRTARTIQEHSPNVAELGGAVGPDAYEVAFDSVPRAPRQEDAVVAGVVLAQHDRQPPNHAVRGTGIEGQLRVTSEQLDLDGRVGLVRLGQGVLSGPWLGIAVYRHSTGYGGQV